MYTLYVYTYISLWLTPCNADQAERQMLEDGLLCICIYVCMYIYIIYVYIICIYIHLSLVNSM